MPNQHANSIPEIIRILKKMPPGQKKSPSILDGDGIPAIQKSLELMCRPAYQIISLRLKLLAKQTSHLSENEHANKKPRQRWGF